MLPTEVVIVLLLLFFLPDLFKSPENREKCAITRHSYYAKITKGRIHNKGYT